MIDFLKTIFLNFKNHFEARIIFCHLETEDNEEL